MLPMPRSTAAPIAETPVNSSIATDWPIFIANASRLAHHHVVLSDGSVQRLDTASSSGNPYRPISSGGLKISGINVG